MRSNTGVVFGFEGAVRKKKKGEVQSLQRRPRFAGRGNFRSDFLLRRLVFFLGFPRVEVFNGRKFATDPLYCFTLNDFRPKKEETNKREKAHRAAYVMVLSLSPSLAGLAVAVFLVVTLGASCDDSWSELELNSMAAADTASSSSAEKGLQPLVGFGSRISQLQEDFRAPGSKRSTMLLNKLMQPLFRALKNDAEGGMSSQMELQRRGEGKMYWRCYFNAVSCFRRRK